MIIIFSGTTEGREISEYLSARHIGHIVCVATESGENVMNPSFYATIHVGRMDESEIEAFFVAEKPDIIIDATHPYAEVVTNILEKVCDKMSIRYVRVRRGESVNLVCSKADDLTEMLNTYKNATELAEALKSTHGNILLTTGSKELACYTIDESLRDRIYVRVLPTIDAIELCKKAGIDERHIIAMYGPHTTAMNEAVLKQFDIHHMVTKSSGVKGGFDEKIIAAKNNGVEIHLIERPVEEDTYKKTCLNKNRSSCIDKVVLSSVEECIIWLGTNDYIECSKEENFDHSDITGKSLHVSLVGIGMGDIDTLTVAGKKAIEEANVVYGASRMISAMKGLIGESVTTKSLYMPDEIVLDLEDRLYDDLPLVDINVAVLFSGDTGIYSGATKLYNRLVTWGKCDGIKIYPGISSFSAFASVLGIDYTHAHLESLHGKSEDEANHKRIKNLISMFLSGGDEVWLLMSGKSDFVILRKLLTDAFESTLYEKKYLKIGIDVGYNIAYENQKIYHGEIDCMSDDAVSNIWDELASSEDGLFITRLYAL